MAGTRTYRVNDQAVCDLWDQGLTVHEICNELDISVSSVRRALKTGKGISVSYNPKVDTGKIKAFAKARWSVAEIAKELGLSEETVREVPHETD